MLKKKATFMNVKGLSETNPKKPTTGGDDSGSSQSGNSGDQGTPGDGGNEEGDQN
jgi:hypothetical protein